MGHLHSTSHPVAPSDRTCRARPAVHSTRLPRAPSSAWSWFGGLGLAVLMLSRSAATDQPKPGVAAAEATSCTIAATTKLGADVVIFDQARGGKPIARFAGAPSPVRVGPFALEASERVPITTGAGKGFFRIDGFVDPKSLPLVTAREVPVVPNHLWIAGDQRVTFVSAASGKLQVRKDVTEVMSQSFTTWASCDDLTLGRGTSKPWSVPGLARGYLAQEDPLPLFAQPAADQAPVISLTGARGMLFWSQKKRNGFVHLVYHGEMVIDAWGRVQDFRALPPGETSDRVTGPVTMASSPSLQLSQVPRVVRTTKEVVFRSGGSAKAPVIGRIEPDTETYVLDVVAGWASVLPKSLHVAPYEDGHFWAKSSDLGL